MNNVKKIKINEKGFTLVELLAAIIVLVSVGTIITSIVVSTLRGTNKTNTLTSVRQNGDFAISLMSKMIRDAKSLDEVPGGTTYTSTSCVVSVPGPLTPTPVPTSYTSIKFTSFDGGSTLFTCDVSGNKITSNSATLIDATAISLSSCSFSCTRQRYLDSPVIGINFSLTEYRPTPVGGGPGVTHFIENTSSIPFQTSVIMRNLE